MDRKRKRVAAIGAAVTLAVAGGGAAYAAVGSGGNQRDALVRDAAQRLNVTPQQLRSALQGAAIDQLQAAVRAGRLTQQQADRVEQRVRAGGLPLGGPGFGPGLRRGFGPGVPGLRALRIGLGAAASYLGLSPEALRRGLAGGKTLAQVARDQGKSAAGLERALLATARAQLDRAVANRRLTSTQADNAYRGLQQRIGDLVNGRLPKPRLVRRWRGGGPGMPDGMPPGPPGPPPGP